jgi:thiol:disulfide interchange protein
MIPHVIPNVALSMHTPLHPAQRPSVHAVARLTACFLAAFAFLALFTPFTPTAHARQSEIFGGEAPIPVTVSASPQRTTVRPGDQFAIAVIFDHAEGWHIQTNDPKPPKEWGAFNAFPTSVTPPSRDSKDAGGLTFGPPQWPKPYPIKVDFVGSGKPQLYDVFGGRAVVYIPVMVAADAALGERTFELITSYQACDDNGCLIPEDVPVKVTITIANDAATTSSSTESFAAFDQSIFAEMASGRVAEPPTAAATADDEPKSVRFDLFGAGFSISTGTILGTLLIVLVAGVGGFILNLTPCVLPIIPLKIMSLQQSAADHGKGRGRTFSLGMAMFLGVVAFWFVIGVLIVGLKTVDAVNQLFGNPWFQLGVGTFITVMALGMIGAFTISLPQSVYAINPRHDTLHGSFLFGVITAILGTPCFGPFAGAAASWATQQPTIIGLAAFTSIGVGMALPYLVLAAKPEWVAFIPRTGPASELVKQVMGLLLLATAAFFFGVGFLALFAEMPYLRGVLHWWIVAVFCTIAAVWLAYRTTQITKSAPKRAIFALVALIIAGSSLAWANSRHNDAKATYVPGTVGNTHGVWTDYASPAESEALAANKVVLIKFTADWCIPCKHLDASVFSKPQVQTALKAADVLPFRADLTSRKAEGWAKLKALREVSIPVLAIQGPAAKVPIKLYYGMTTEDVINAINKARGTN